MKTKARFRIVPFKNRGGSKSYRVTGTKRDKTQVRENFDEHSDALTRQQELESEFHGYRQDGTIRQVHTRLEAWQVADAEAAVAVIGGDERIKHKTLREVAEFYRANYREPIIKMPMCCESEEQPSALKLFIDAKQSAKRRPESIRDLRQRIGALAKLHPDKLVSDIATADVEAVIHKSSLSPQSRKNMRRVLFGFFKWCVKKKFCDSNPVALIETIKADYPEPQILEVDKVRVLLEHATSFKGGTNLPYFVLSLFCGVRPAEIGRISWKNINIEEKLIVIGADIAKMRERRNVDIPDNAIEFLSPLALKRVPIRSKNWRKDHLKIRELAGFGTATKEKPDLKPWPSDVLRHTAISNHFAHYKHEGKTAEWAGNSPDVIHKHYKGLVTAKQSAEFWDITPRTLSGEIIKLKAA